MIRFSVARFNRLRKRQLLLALLGVTFLGPTANAADILVTSTADSGAGSLRAAFTAAESGDRIVFDLPGTPTIVLLSDLPDVSVDLSFANNNVPDVTIDRNGNGPLTFTGGLLDPTVLVVIPGGAVAPDIDASAGTTVFGDGVVSGDLLIPGTLAPGASESAGSVGTFDVTGDVDLSAAQVELDLSATGGTLSNDLINIDGIATVTGATLVPNFVGTEFAIGQQFLVLDSTNAIVGPFANQGDTFQLPNNPFLQAIEDLALPADDFGFEIEDNNRPFTSVVTGCNPSSAAQLLDQLRAGAPPAAVLELRNGSTSEVLLAIDQLSGSIYPSLIGAEINHIQNNLESVRDLMVWQTRTQANELTPWVRGYGLAGDVDRDDCDTLGYLHRTGGVELGCGLGSNVGLTGNIFSHLASGTLNVQDVDQKADIDSYRLGGSVAYVGQDIYVIAAGGAGVQNYDVRRSLSALEGSSFVQSSFDGSAQFGYLELACTTQWTPYLAMHATRVDLDSVTETGDANFALINDGGDGDSLRGVFGIAFAKSAPTVIGLARTRLRFGWMHEYLNESETIVSQIAGGGTPTGSLVDRGVSVGRDWGFARAQVEAGTLLGGQFMVAYQGYFNAESSINSLIAGTAWAY